MGFDDTFGMAFAKAQASAYNELPVQPPATLIVTVNDRDKETVLPLIRKYHEIGFKILATAGTQKFLTSKGVPAETVFKVGENRPNMVDLIVSGEVQLLINTPLGPKVPIRRFRSSTFDHHVQGALSDYDGVGEGGPGRADRAARRPQHVRTVQERIADVTAPTASA